MTEVASIPKNPPDGPDLRWMWILTLAAGFAAAAVFLLWPSIDRVTADLFLLSDGRYVLKGTSMGSTLRIVFKTIFAGGAAFALLALLLSYFLKRRVLGRPWLRWLYLVVCLIIGPGLVANVIFKDNWGRARPVQVSDQAREFTPPLILSDQCERNCSFVSGEASSVFALFFAASLIGSAWWRALLGSGLVLGSVAGLIRMAQGAHYFSDVIFAAVFMALAVLALHWVFFRREYGQTFTR